MEEDTDRVWEEFLMYRVELKATMMWSSSRPHPHVPNVPCGVESYFAELQERYLFMFLMYRVELKVRTWRGVAKG